MEKKKLILLGVAALCIVGAGVMLLMNSRDTGPKPVPQVPIEEEFKKSPESKKQFEETLKRVEQETAKGRPPAGG